MALDKLVDSALLDASLEDVADAIRAKGGTSASLSFPVDFVNAIDAIETGGGGSGGLSLIKTITLEQDVNSVSTAFDSALAAYDFVVIKLQFSLTEHDWLYYGVNGANESYDSDLKDHDKILLIFYVSGWKIAVPSTTSVNGKALTVGDNITIRAYVATKLIQAGSTLTFYGGYFD